MPEPQQLKPQQPETFQSKYQVLPTPTPAVEITSAIEPVKKADAVEVSTKAQEEPLDEQEEHKTPEFFFMR